MDIGELIKAPMADQNWWKKCLIIGLMCIVPIAGMLNLLGWSKACYKSRATGDGMLPEASFSYVGDGFWVFMAILPIVGVMIVLEIILGILAAVTHRIHIVQTIVTLGGGLVVLVIALIIGICMPAILYRHYVHGDRWASLNFGGFLGIVKGFTGPYLMLWLCFLVAGILGGLGEIACGVGVLLTLPFGYAMQAFAIADFEKLTKA